MIENSMAVEPELLAFLNRNNFTSDEFRKTNLEWSELVNITKHHRENTVQLENTGRTVVDSLRLVPDIHSLKLRIKNPEKVVAKIIRKKLDDPDRVITLTSYKEELTDLIGIRALHLFKGQWKAIHDYINATWNLHERPIAYVREGDSEKAQQLFETNKCEVKKHPFGYRSVHYIIVTQPDKYKYFVEIQVRTLFEEGWSEIDHILRYPQISNDPYLAEFLQVFNRLAGSADEMGTFISNLSAYLRTEQFKSAELEKQHTAADDKLKKTISELNVTKDERKRLKTEVENLQRASWQDSVAPLSRYFQGSGGPLTLPDVAMADPVTGTFGFPGDANEPFARRCKNCGAKYRNDSFLLNSLDSVLCPNCSKSLLPFRKQL